MAADSDQRGVGSEVAAEPPRVVHLRDEEDVRERHAVAVQVPAVGRAAQRKLLEAAEPFRDPVPVPGRHGLLALRQRTLEVVEDPQVVEGMDVAGDGERHRADHRPLTGIRRQQRRIRASLVQVLDDRYGLAEDPARVLERWHESLRIEREVVLVPVLATAPDKVQRHVLDLEPLEVQGNPHAVGGGAAEIGVELHAATIPCWRTPTPSMPPRMRSPGASSPACGA